MATLYKLNGEILTLQRLAAMATGKELFFEERYCRKKAEYVDVLKYALLVGENSFTVSQMIYLKTLANVPDVTDKQTRDEFMQHEIHKMLEAMRNFGDKISFNAACRDGLTLSNKYNWLLNYHEKKIAVTFAA